MLTDNDLTDLERWIKKSSRCPCKDCTKLAVFARNYFAVRDGEPFRTEMMEKLNEDQRQAFVRLICLRNLSGGVSKEQNSS